MVLCTLFMFWASGRFIVHFIFNLQKFYYNTPFVMCTVCLTDREFTMTCMRSYADMRLSFKP